jgi:hypothetical protein
MGRTGAALLLLVHACGCTKAVSDGSLPPSPLLWLKEHASSSGAAVSVDADGHLAVVGSTITTAEFPEGNLVGPVGVWIRRCDGAGTEQWVRAHDVTGSNATGSDVAVDAAGNIFAAGHSQPTASLRKYDPAGNEQWLVTGEYSGGSAAAGADASGNAYLAFGGSASNPGALIKYDAGGSMVWSQPVAVAEQDVVTGLAVGADGRSAVVAVGITATGACALLVVRDANGEELWQTSWCDGGYAEDVAIGLDGSVVIAGVQADDSFLVRKYDASGAELWTRNDGPKGGTNIWQSAAVDADGAIAVGGRAVYGTNNARVARYDPTGNLVAEWAGEGLPLWNGASVEGVAIAPNGDIAVVGTAVVADVPDTAWVAALFLP